jgi:hypothetical protein
MKRALVTGLLSTALLFGAAQSARADAFLSLSNGSTTLTCNNSTGAGVAACTSAGFTTALGSNAITFGNGITSTSVGGYKVTSVTLGSNSPGDPSIAFAVDTKTKVQNISAGSTALTVNFAVNNFALPAGSPLILSTSQSGTFTRTSVGSQEAFTGYANAGNTLVPGVGAVSATPNCVNNGAISGSCATVGPDVLFGRSGPFALSGTQVINLNQGNSAASFAAQVNALPTPVPEPGSVVLLATGLLGIAVVLKRRNLLTV